MDMACEKKTSRTERLPAKYGPNATVTYHDHPCGGELVYLMSGFTVPQEGISLSELLKNGISLYKCNSCGDITVK